MMITNIERLQLYDIELWSLTQMSGDIFTPFVNLNSQHLDSNFNSHENPNLMTTCNYNPTR